MNRKTFLATLVGSFACAFLPKKMPSNPFEWGKAPTLVIKSNGEETTMLWMDAMMQEREVNPTEFDAILKEASKISWGNQTPVSAIRFINP